MIATAASAKLDSRPRCRSSCTALSSCSCFSREIFAFWLAKSKRAAVSCDAADAVKAWASLSSR